jgi:hypothetical protein
LIRRELPITLPFYDGLASASEHRKGHDSIPETH